MNHRNLLHAAALSVLAVLAACGPRKAAPAPAPQARSFPKPDIPAIYQDMGERTDYLVAHFWDKFTDTTQCFAGDTTMVNGVHREELEGKMSLFATLASQVSQESGVQAMARLYDRVEAYERKHPEAGMYKAVMAAVSDLVPEARHAHYDFVARMALLNRVGTRAADFRFIDSKGRLRTLYSVEAEYLILIFGNPDCPACRDLVAAMDGSLPVTERIADGRLKVLDVYIDEEIDEWKAHLADYPKTWINGYDPTHTLRADLTYNVRAIPSIYLLDRDKTVLLKDVPQERLMHYLTYKASL